MRAVERFDDVLGRVGAPSVIINVGRGDGVSVRELVILGLPATIQASTIMTGMTFFSIGSFRSRWSPMPWWRSGLETFAIGMSAATIAYVVGVLLGGIIH